MTGKIWGLTIRPNTIRSEDLILSNQPRLVKAVVDIRSDQHFTTFLISTHSLDAFPPHDIQHLLCALLIQTSPRVPVPDIRLDVKRLRGEPRIRLRLERRQGSVVAQSREERPHRVGDMGDESGAVPKCHWEHNPRTSISSVLADDNEGRGRTHYQ